MTVPKHDGWDCLMHVKYVQAVHYDTALNHIRKLEAALLQYGYHDETCDFLRDTLPCSCGFESLRADIAPEEPT